MDKVTTLKGSSKNFSNSDFALVLGKQTVSNLTCRTRVIVGSQCSLFGLVHNSKIKRRRCAEFDANLFRVYF